MATVQLTKYYVQIIAESNDPAFLHLVNNVHGIEKLRQRNTYRCSLALLPEVLRELKGITSVDQLNGAARVLYEEELLRRSKTAELLESGPDEHYDGLWGHQDLGVCLAKYNRRYNFFYDTRTGKTRMSYQVIYNAIAAGKIKRALVVTNATIIDDWLRDAEVFPQLKVYAYYGRKKAEALSKPCHVLIWSSGMFAANVEFLKRCGFDMCIFDESSALKNETSKISKAALDYSLTVPYWYNLSATPAPNNKYEYYTQMRCVDHYCFSPAITHFRSRYFDDISRSKDFHKWQIKAYMEAEFMDIVKSRSIYVDQSVMPMSEAFWHPVTYHMSDETQQLYKQMAGEMVVSIGDKQITASQATFMRAKLQQIVAGFVLDSEAIKNNKYARRLHLEELEEPARRTGATERLDALDKLLAAIDKADPGASVIIWAHYTEEFKMLKERLGSRCATVRGGVPTQQRQFIIEAFRQRRFPYLLAHPRSLGKGVNLTVAHHAIYYNLTDSWEAFKQSAERIRGHITVQPNDCHYWVLIAEKSVNQVVYEGLQNKKQDAIAFMDHLKAVTKDVYERGDDTRASS